MRLRVEKGGAAFDFERYEPAVITRCNGSAQIGKTIWQTAMFPKDGRYLLPLKTRIRQAEDLAEGDLVSVRITVDL